MNYLSLLGKRLKDDDVIEILESANIEVIYDFDRLHENIPDRYWAGSQKDGFQFGFDENQILELIFLYVLPSEGFAAVRPENCDVRFFSSIPEAEAHAAGKRLGVTKGQTTFLGIQRAWVRLEDEKRSVHYEFHGDQLARVTITKTRS